MVASDGHKLVRCKTLAARGNERAAFILPKKPATLLKNLLPKESGMVVIEFDERNAVFTLESYRMVCRLIEGRYPNYNSVIPVRNVRRDAMDKAKAMKKAGELTEDTQKTMEEEVQKLTDKYIKNIDAAVEEKQKEIMSV